MKDKFTISEFAKLKNITPETLRYYDRIGLLKPSSVDPNTGYRYYSLTQYDKLSNIVEFRQLEMSIEEIKEFYNNKNVVKSAEILKKRLEILEYKIVALQQVYNDMSKKVHHMELALEMESIGQIQIKEMPTRRIMVGNPFKGSEGDKSVLRFQLEKEIQTLTSLVGIGQFGIKMDHWDSKKDLGREKELISMFIFVDEFLVSEEKTQVLNGGFFACAYYKGDLFRRAKRMQEIITEIIEMGYEVCGEAIAAVEVGVAITDIEDERIHQFQIPVKKRAI